MSQRPTQDCERIRDALLTGPADPALTGPIADHLATCDGCRRLSAQLARDRAELRTYLDDAGWLPVANRVFAALPERGPRRRWGRARAGGRSDGPAAAASLPATGTRRPPVGIPAMAPARPLTTAFRAACLVLIGLGAGLVGPAVWPDGSDPSSGGSERSAPVQLGAADTDTGAVASGTADGYAPAPGDNPPLIVPGSFGGVTAVQNRETWRAVQSGTQGQLSPLLYPSVPPGFFDAVVVETMGPTAASVRYGTDDGSMAIVLSTGETATATGAASQTVEVRGAPAGVSVMVSTTPGEAGLPLEGETATALAPGTTIEIAWQETVTPSGQPLPYRVAASGLPLDVVMAFVGSLVPLGDGWDELASAVPAGTAILAPASMPAGFGAARLAEHRVAATGSGTEVRYLVSYERPGAAGIDRIDLSAAPVADAEVTPEPGATSRSVTIAGQPATWVETSPTDETPASTSVRWVDGGTAYRIDFSGAGLTAAEIDATLAGLTVTRVARTSDPRAAAVGAGRSG